jgi:hypothetical protein
LHTVEVRLDDDDVAGAMSQMRIWLDHHRFEPDSFRQAAEGAETRFRLEFKIEGEAVAFAAAFHGRMLEEHDHAVEGAAYVPARHVRSRA